VAIRQTEKKNEDAWEMVFVQTVLQPGDPPRKFKRHYEKATRTTKGETISLVYDGKTIVFDLAGNQYKASAEGDGLGPLPLANLVRSLNDEIHVEHALVPSKPVKLNERWTLQRQQVAGVFGKIAVIEPSTSRGEAKLTKVYFKDGQQFGVIDYDIVLAIKEIQGAKFSSPILGTVKGTVEAAIDGSSTSINSSWDMKTVGKVFKDVQGKQVPVELNITATGRREQSNELPGK
jgi:hypothetical protein